MTGYLWAAQLLTAAAAVAAFGLALALARRVRLLQERFEELAQLGADLPTPGEPVPAFTATTTDGAVLSAADLAGPDVLLLFLTSSCESCREEVGRLRAEPPAVGEPTPVAVVIGQQAERAQLVSDLAPVARVVEQDDHSALAARFGVRGFPGVVVAGDGVIRRVGHLLDEVRVGARA